MQLEFRTLEYSKVEEYNCTHLKQKYYGKTNISEFSQPRTMVLWSSFITGENKEKEVLKGGNKEMWNKIWGIKDTLFSHFNNPAIIDLPGFSYNLKVHEDSRNLLKSFFEQKEKDKKEKIKLDYNNHAFEHHKKIKKEFFNSLENGHDMVLGYFSVIDVIGHLNFGNNTIMKMIYKEFDEIAKAVKNKNSDVLIISDHGMKAIGSFGDHSEYGFWSSDTLNLDIPKITDFYEIIKKIRYGIDF